jgi:predicted phage-related endonuclease
VARNEEVIASIRAMAAAFWDLVITRTPPDPERWTCSLDAVRALYPTVAREVVELPANAADLATALLDAKRRAKEAEAEADHLQATLCMMMGDAAKATAGGYRLNWTQTSASRFDSTAFKEAHPDLHAAFCRTTTGRRFTAFGPTE